MPPRLHCHCPPTRARLRLHRYSSDARHESDQNFSQSASEKLFADAAREEAEEAAAPPPKPTRIPLLEHEHENWTGEESMRDAVLRMLVDKYKPLRSGSMRSAEEKLKQTPPQLQSGRASPEATSWANQPLLPSIENHRPWHTTFKAPSDATSAVKFGNFPSNPTSQPRSTSDEERAKKKDREEQRRLALAGRLTDAKESTLDYRLGIRNPRGDLRQRRPNPVSMKGWGGFIEEKIERARLAGQFDVVKGRGKPLAQGTDNSNPFIAREEFLMNRIVQRNGAAPPWVEVQGELESAITSFREILRQSWIRRVVRNLTISHPPAILATLDITHIASIRDREWEERERGYHETALGDLNSLVRKYNTLAPYVVRRPYYTRKAELEMVYEGSGEEVRLAIAERIKSASGALGRQNGHDSEEKLGAAEAGIDTQLRIRDLVRRWWTKWFRK